MEYVIWYLVIGCIIAAAFYVAAGNEFNDINDHPGIIIGLTFFWPGYVPVICTLFLIAFLEAVKKRVQNKTR